MSHRRCFRRADIALAAALVLAACTSTTSRSPQSIALRTTTIAAVPQSDSATTAAGAAASATPPAATTVPGAAPQSKDNDPHTVETAIIAATNCTIDEQFGRGLAAISFLIAGIGPSDITRPHQPIDGSFTCNAAPVGTQAFGAARFADPTQAAEMVSWFTQKRLCRPVATAGSWMLFAARAPDQPQVSDELERAVATLGGQMIDTCR